MRRVRLARRPVLPRSGFGIALSLLVPCVGTGQEPERRIEGLVVGTGGETAAGLPVMLHRMGDAGGALLATDTTSAEGRFSFTIPEDEPGALHFAAASAEGALFVGPVLAPGAEAPDPYRIVLRPGVEAGSVVLEDGSVLPPDAFSSATPLAQPSTAPVRDDPRAAALAILGTLALLLALALHARARARRAAFRRAIVELAELDAGEAGGGHVPRGLDLEERRNELRERAHALRPR
ncbi:MAG TPA: hypothetical protein VK837_12145 [Longimicrobiales bacterium]|nr:hypothetical protein [Longimicrobiales bacterium]